MLCQCPSHPKSPRPQSGEHSLVLVLGTRLRLTQLDQLRFEKWVLEPWPSLSGFLGSLSWQCSVLCMVPTVRPICSEY